jgi:hypothetical protein
MHPYRDSPMPLEETHPHDSEEPILYSLLAAIGAIPVAIALATHAAFGGEATVGVAMMATGGVGLLARFVRVRRQRPRT